MSFTHAGRRRWRLRQAIMAVDSSRPRYKSQQRNRVHSHSSLGWRKLVMNQRPPDEWA